VRLLQRSLELTDTAPLTEEELRGLIAEEEKRARDAIQTLELLGYAPIVSDPPPPGTRTVGNQEAVEYDKQCRKILRRIWVLLHPDRLKEHPAYSRLTERQKRDLEEVWNDALKISSEELSRPEWSFGYSRRAIEFLKESLERAERELQSAGIDTSVSLQVRGETARERIAWYQTETRRLERDLVRALALLTSLRQDPAVQERQRLLNMKPEEQENVKTQIKERMRKYLREAKSLETRLRKRMKKGGHDETLRTP
jgi:hypothetical protein